MDPTRGFTLMQYLKKIFFSVEGSSITHTDPEEKRNIKATWQAPDDPNLGFVVFKYSVVMDYTNYYAKLSLKPMKISR